MTSWDDSFSSRACLAFSGISCLAPPDALVAALAGGTAGLVVELEDKVGAMIIIFVR